MADAGPTMPDGGMPAPGPVYTPDPTTPGWGSIDRGDGSAPQTVPESEALAAGASVASAPPTAGSGPADASAAAAPLPTSTLGLPATLLPSGVAPYGGPEPVLPDAQPQAAPIYNPDDMGLAADEANKAALQPPPAPPDVQPAGMGAPGLAPSEAPNPNAEVLSPGGVQMGPSETETSHTVLSPEARIQYAEEMGSAHIKAIQDEAAGQRAAELAKTSALDNGAAAALAQNLEQQRAIAAMQTEHQRVIDGIQAHPINEKEFWTTGRTIGAAIALALSGFAHGISGGRDQTVSIVSGMIDGAVNRWLKQQAENRNSVLSSRTAAMQSNNAASASLRMQAYALINKKIGYEAEKAGLAALPPAGQALAAQAQQQTANEILKIGAEVDQKAKQKVEQTAPVTVADAKLVGMGLGPTPEKAREQFAAAMGAGQSQGNLGAKISAADRLAAASATLEHIAQQNGGTLPNQSIFSTDNIQFFRTLWARMGNKTSVSAAQAQQELNQALLELRRSLPSSKLADSEAEGRVLNYTLDSGETSSTLAAIRAAAVDAQRNMNDTALRFAPGHGRDLIDFVRQEEHYGATTAQQQSAFRPGVTKAPASESDILQASGVGGPAPESPLAQSRPGSQPATAAAPANEESPPMQLSTIQAIHREASANNLNGDAITRIIRFESGGHAAAKNPSGATGLIQWMPKVFESMPKPAGYEGVRHSDLPDLTAEEQVPLVMEYFKGRGLGPNSDIGDYYLAVAAPGMLGQPDSKVVYPKGSAAWTQNPAWRPADGGDITVGSIKALARRF